MNYLTPTFKLVSVVFACAAIVTGVQALTDPVGFSCSFGIPITIVKDASIANSAITSNNNGNPNTSYVSLMGVRQLATGITLLTFAYQGKWKEMATILAILGFVVAGTDGFHLYCAGAKEKAIFHAVPGALIATLAGAFLVTNI